MKRLTLLFLCLAALWSFPALSAAMEVAEGVITTEVRDRVPVDAVQTYSASVGKLYCFTRITGAAIDTTITHVWYRAGEEMARVELPVRSSNWRTWSSKNILPEHTGEWKVDILDAEGNILVTIPFVLI
jgi:hypothetical protein